MDTQDLMEMSTAELVELHNSLADGPRRPRPSPRRRCWSPNRVPARRSGRAGRSRRRAHRDRRADRRGDRRRAATTEAEPTASTAEPASPTEEKKPRGKGVGRLAREFILAHPDKTYRQDCRDGARSHPRLEPHGALGPLVRQRHEEEGHRGH